MITEEQESPITAAAVMLVAQDIRDVVEACAAQLVRPLYPMNSITEEYSKIGPGFCVYPSPIYYGPP